MGCAMCGLRIWALGLIAGATMMAGAAQAQTMPSMRFERGVLVSPSAAQAYYGSATTRSSSFTGVSGFEGRPPEIVEQARALGDIDAIYEYTRNHIEVEFAFGLRKGALGALIDRSGTPFDINVLFVELARQVGYTARYQIGTATFNAQQFEDWTGLTDGVAACRMLAYAGFPAAINGASPSDCSVSNAITSVAIRHIWSEVQIGGTWYVFDPSFKPHDFATRRNLESDSGLTSGAAVTTAASGITSGAVQGQSYIRNVNTGGLDAYLTARSQELLAELGNDFDGSMRDVIGGSEIVPVYASGGGFRETSSAYTSSSDQTITGSIPDQYRTGMEIYASTSFGNFTRQLWVDEIYGRRLEFDSNFDAEHVQSPEDYDDLSFRLELDDVALNTITGTGLPSFNYTATLTLNHPYAADSGGYVDQTLNVAASGAVPTAIIHGYGRVSPGLGAAWNLERSEDEALPGRTAGWYNCTPEWSCNPQYAAPAGDMSRQRTGSSWLAQLSRMLDLQGAIGASAVQHHHSLSFVRWAHNWQTFQMGPQGPFDFGISNQQLILDFRTALSVSHRTGDANRERAVSRAIATAGAMLEGSVVEQNDMPDVASTAARFGWANAPDEDPCATGARRFFDFSGASLTTLENLMTFDGTSGGCSASSIQPAGRSATRHMAAGVINAFLTAGFSVSGSEESFMGPGSRLGAVSDEAICQPNESHPCSLFAYEGSLQRGASFVANRFDTNGDVLEVAHIVLVGGEIAKGSGGGSPESSVATFDPRRAADVLRDRFVDRSSALGVSLTNGSVSYATPTLLSVGAGEGAPYRLDYNLIFQAGPACSGQFGPCSGPPQSGWTHNWNINFTLGGSALEAMGQTTPLAATDSVVAILALQDTFMQTGVDNLRRDIYAALIADWWRRRMVGNVATVTRAFSGQQYLRRADNTWQAPVGSPGVLTQTGTRVKIRDTCNPNPSQWPTVPAQSRRWDAQNVTFSLRNPGGDVMEFESDSGGFSLNQCDVMYWFYLTEWSWPQGPSVTFNSNGSIASSLGRSMSIGAYASSGGRTGGFTGPNWSAIYNSAGAAWTFDLLEPTARSATQRPRDSRRLRRVYEPTNPSQPALEYTYDALGRVREARDAVALQATRDPHEFFIAERVRGRRIDPEGGVFTVYYDVNGDAIRFTDELNRAYSADYDGRHRVTQRTYPEGDFDEFAYDSFDNVIGLTRNAKPGSGLSDLTISATYNTTWNQIASITDARGNTTTFTYHPSGNGAGQMATAVRPAVGGSSPTYTFAYNAIGLVSSETDPTGRTTTHAYNGYGDRTSTTVATTAVGGSALNLTTTFTPDSWGDIVTVLDPRGNATSTTYDAMRRPTLVRRHDGNASAALLGATRTSYDALGRVIETEGGTAFSGANVTAWLTTETSTYTPTGQVATVTNGENNITTNAYDDLDRLLQVTDPVGRITRNEYDAAGQLLRVIRAYGTGLSQDYARYTYTPNGQRASVRDANNNRSVYVYDGFDRLCRLYFPSAALGANAANTGGIAENALTCSSAGTNPDYEGYGYDANGNRTSLRLRSGETIAFTYDALNRETVKDIPGGASADVHTLYDRLSSRFVSASGDGIIYAYDAAGRLLSEQSTIGTTRTLAFQYDSASNRTRITWPDANYASYTYDALNRVDIIQENGSTTLANYDYDALGRRATLTRGNGTVTTFDYDDASRLTDLAHDLNGGSTNDQAYGFTYTAASQLAQRTATNDAYNWAAPQVNRSYNRNGLNQYTSVGGVAFSYSGGDGQRGNLTSDGSRNFDYDLENRLIGVSGSASMTLGYDPLGRLRTTTASSATTEFLYDGDRMVAEYNQSGGALLRRYVHGPGVDEPIVWYEGSGLTDRRYLVTDHLGSVIAENGSSTMLYSYGPYGEPNAWTGARFRYTGQAMLPEVQLYHYKARVYDPVLGRFLQTDPIGYEYDFNLFAYADNDPFSATDPTGAFALAAVGTGAVVRDVYPECRGSDTTCRDRAERRAPFRLGELENARRRGVARAWAAERDLVRAGRPGTRDWTPRQRRELLREGKVRGFRGHHINTVNGNPIAMAENPNNVRFLTRAEHDALHRAAGGTRTPIRGQPLLNRSIPALAIITTITGILSGRIRTDTQEHFNEDMIGLPSPEDEDDCPDRMCA
jgi:RHS repeat-associated protein